MQNTTYCFIMIHLHFKQQLCSFRKIPQILLQIDGRYSNNVEIICLQIKGSDCGLHNTTVPQYQVQIEPFEFITIRHGRSNNFPACFKHGKKVLQVNVL